MDFNLDFNTKMDLDLNLFDNDGIDRKCRIHRPKSHRRPKTVKYKYAQEFVKECSKDILNGQRLFCFVSGRFILGDIIEAFAVDNNLLIKELTISSLSISKDNIDSLYNILNFDYCEKLNLIVSDFFYAHNRHNMKYIYDKLDIDNKFQLAVASTHTKIILMELESGQKIVISGSANLKSSDSLEQISIETDEDLYCFNYDWHKILLDKYKTINKSIRSEKMWDLVK